MELTRITSLDQLDQYRDDWSLILEENHNTNPFIEFVWVYEWLKHVGDEYDMEIMLVKQDGRPIGFIPFIHKKRWFCHTYTFMAFGHANYMDFVVYNYLLDDVIEFVFDEMIKVRRNVVFYLHGLLESGKTPKSLELYLQKRKFVFSSHRVVTPYINLKDVIIEEYMNKRKRLHGLDRREKRLRKNGNVKFLRVGPEEMELVFQLRDKLWKKKRDTSGFSKDKEKAFYLSLAGVRNGPMQTELDALYINDTMIAFHYGFRCRGRLLVYVLAYDLDFEIFGPGRILEKEKILQCKTDNINIFDFSIGYEPYKFEWNTDEDYTRKMIFSSNTSKANGIRRFLTLKESLIERMKRNYSFVLFIRNTIGKLLFIFRNLFRKAESKAIKEEIMAYLTSVKEYVFERKRYIVYKLDGKEILNLSGSKSFIELSINDAINSFDIANNHMKEICRKIYGGFKGFYPAGILSFENIFWINEKMLRIDHIAYHEDFRGKCVYIDNWNNVTLRDICTFVQQHCKAKTIYVTIKGNSKKDIAALKELGFTFSKQIVKRTYFGVSKYYVTE
ncbi:GNAT family N-acetyltransferase [Sporosarcina sp. ACRSL]|uniref:GNAT family N-acetyltransferase n=1 Tax=Sporosarcina sp. ACRSL TaxID=2918215 RepID=UPI001EF570FD|nr:GNAT family N-acetyltransferase [Sporosarcina sp. ACRSL]MCG7345451.1 GNAT family N-acetyltransferase [Sporosarcina sp. ACRSL]